MKGVAVRRLVLLLAGLILAGGGLMPSNAVAISATGCPDRFQDETNDSLLDETAVTQSSNELSRIIDGDVYVLGFQTEPDEGVGAYLDTIYATCTELQGPGGSVRGNVMLFVFTLEPDVVTAIEVGESYYDEISEDEQYRISDDVFGQAVANGDPTPGVIDAQKAIAKKFEPSKAGTVLTWAGFVTLLVLLAAGAVALVAWRRAKRRDAEAVSAKLKREAKAAANETSEKIKKLIDDIGYETTKEEYKQLKAKTPRQVFKPELDALAVKAEKLFNDAVASDAAWNDVSAELDPDKELSDDQYDLVIVMNNTTTRLVEEATEAIGSFSAACNDFKERLEDPLEAVAKLRNILQYLESQEIALRQDGVSPNNGDLLALAGSNLDVAEQMVRDSGTMAAVMEMAEAETTMEQVRNRQEMVRPEPPRPSPPSPRPEAPKKPKKKGGEEKRSKQKRRPEPEARPRKPAGSGGGIRLPGGFGGGGSRPSRRTARRSQPKPSTSIRRATVRRSGVSRPRRSIVRRRR